jgi:hypothetical protein
MKCICELIETANLTLRGLINALIAGNLKLAGEIIWTGLKLAWLQALKRRL